MTLARLGLRDAALIVVQVRSYDVLMETFSQGLFDEWRSFSCDAEGAVGWRCRHDSSFQELSRLTFLLEAVRLEPLRGGPSRDGLTW